MTIYRLDIDYDVLASYSLDALKGYSPGWCDPVFVSQTPLIYDLYVDRSENNSVLHPGKKIGSFELRRRPNGQAEILFIDRTLFVSVDSGWTDKEKKELAALPDNKKRDYLYDRREKINEKDKALRERLSDHFDEVVKVYFRYLWDWEIVPSESAAQSKHLEQHGKIGRPHYPEDEWAYEQVNYINRLKSEVYEEWLLKAKSNPERSETLDTNLGKHFKKIIKPEWRIKKN